MTKIEVKQIGRLKRITIYRDELKGMSRYERNVMSYEAY